MLDDYYEMLVKKYLASIKKDIAGEEFFIQKKLAAYYAIITGDSRDLKNICTPVKQLEYWAMEDAWNIKEEEYHKNIELPTCSKKFEEWYEEIKRLHKSAVNNFFDFLAEEANLKQLAFYIIMESSIDGRFDDIIAMAQVGLQGEAKIVAAKNYWDEMGRGKLDRMHTVMFNRSVKCMQSILEKSNLFFQKIEPSSAGLKNGNLILMYATRRKYNARLLGAIGVLEDTASDRFKKTVNALRRLSVPETAIAYHEEHIYIDSKHGEEWFEQILLPLSKTEDPQIIKEIAIGVLIRYRIAVDYYQDIENKIEVLQ